MKRALTAVAFFVTLILAWQWVCAAGIWSPVLVPSPAHVARYLWEAVRDGSLGSAAAVTVGED